MLRHHSLEINVSRLPATSDRLFSCLSLLFAFAFVTVPVAGQSANPQTKPTLGSIDGVGIDRYGDPLPSGAIARLGSQRWRHQNVIHAVITADGKKVVSVSGAGGRQLCRWDAATGKKLYQHSLEFDVGSAMLSPDGNYLVGGSGSLSVWDVERKALRPLEGTFHSWVPLAFSADSKLVAASGRDGMVYVSDVASGKAIQRIQARPESFITALAISPDAKVLATAELATGLNTTENDSTIVVCDARTGKTLWKAATGQKGRLNALSFSPDGRILASGGSDGALRFWDAAAGKEVVAFDKILSDTSRLAFSPNGKLLAVSADANIRILDVVAQKVLREWKAHSNRTTTLAFAPDNTTLLSSEDSSSILRFWDAPTGKEIKSVGGHHGAVIRVAFTADGKHVLSGARGDETVRQWNLDGSGETVLFGWRSWAFFRGGLDFSADGALAATGHEDQREAHLWSMVGAKPRLLAKLPGSERRLAFSPDGRLLAAIGWGEPPVIRLWDTATGKESKRIKATLEKNEEIYSFAVSPDSKILAVRMWVDNKFAARQKNWIRIWDVPAAKLIKSIESKPAEEVVFSPDSQWLANPATASFINIQTGNEYRPVDVPERSEFVVFSADGRYQAWCGADFVHVLESATGREAYRLRAPGARVYAAAISPDLRHLVTGHEDSIVLVWDLTGRHGDPRLRLNDSDLARHWSALGEAGPTDAFRAFWLLTQAPEKSVPFLTARLQPVKGADSRVIERHINDLNSAQFAVRDRAVQELERLADLAEAALRKALDDRPPLEVQRRIEKLLAGLELPIRCADRLRAVRVVAVLEHAGGADAPKLLRVLAEGAPEAILTREARAALARMAKRNAKP